MEIGYVGVVLNVPGDKRKTMLQRRCRNEQVKSTTINPLALGSEDVAKAGAAAGDRS